MSLMAQYTALLNRRPLLTKAVTSGVLCGLGDFMCQTIEKRTIHYYL